jgi:thioesterase domain-containing protein/aryl carrier-like protein
VCKSELDTKEIKGYLLNKLPEYMVPFHYRIIDSIPLSSNGKVDRKALPKFKPDICNDKELILPRNDMEKRLAEICGKLLEIDILSINDNLYDLGWDSVRMISLASKIQHDFGVKIPFRIMMENPTIKAVSQFISNADNGDENIVTLLNQKHQRNIFAFPPVSSYGFVYKELAGKLNNCSLYSFDFIEDEDIIKLYTDEILKIQDNGAYVLLGFCGGGNIAFEVAKELFSRGHKVTDIILLDAYYSLENAIVQMDSQIKTKFKQSTLDILNQKYSNKFSVDSLFDKGIRVKIDNYMDMIVKTCSSDGDVSSDIHYVCAEGDMEYKAFLREKAHKWSSLTTGKFNWYNGSGKHDEMLLDRFVGKNAEVLRKILNKITA